MACCRLRTLKVLRVSHGWRNFLCSGGFLGATTTENCRGELLIALIPHIVRAPEFNEVNLRGISAGNDANVKLNYLAEIRSGKRLRPGDSGSCGPKPAPRTEPAKPAEPVQPRLLFNPATATVQLNAPVTVQLVLENVSDLYMAPMKLKFDPKVLRLTSVRPDNSCPRTGKKSTSLRTP